jgi:hypothetical protein
MSIPRKTFDVLAPPPKRPKQGPERDFKLNPIQITKKSRLRSIRSVTPAPHKVDIDTIMRMLELGGTPDFESKAQKTSWPKDFFEAVMRNDWREWIESIKKEQDGRNDNDATAEVLRRKMEQGTSVIPLGEFFSKKRSGSCKFRQHAM